MASEVDLCNLALSFIGQQADVSSIEPPDGSVEADYCAQFYPQVRDELLQNHPWGFATSRASLSLLVESAPYPWQFAYALPSDCVQPWSVLRPADARAAWSDPTYLTIYQRTMLPLPSDNDTQPYVLETDANDQRVIYTNVQNAILLYARGVTATGAFPPLFRTALARLLAAYLAGSIIKGGEGVKISAAQYRFYEKAVGLARERDANGRQSNAYTNYTPSAILSRL